MGNLFWRRNNPDREPVEVGDQSNLHVEVRQQNQGEREDAVKRVYIKMKSAATTHDMYELSKVKKYMELLENQTWFLDFRYDNISYSYMLSLIEQCQGVQTLQVILSSVSVFPLQIMQPKFHSLRKLVLSNSSLTTIEFMTYIDCPNLKELNLCNNLITSIRPLRRARVKLEILNIRLNLLTNLWDNSIQMIDFNQEVAGLNFEEIAKPPSPFTPYYGDDVHWIFKLNCQTIVRLELNGNDRIPINWGKLDMIKKKFKGENDIFCWGPQTKGYPYPQ